MSDIEIAHHLDRLMRRIHAHLTETASEFDTHRLGPAGGMLLLTLAEIEPAPIHELVSRLARDKSQITRAIKSLENKGLVEREGDPEDGRVSMLALTQEGHDTVHRIKMAVADGLGKILTPLSTAEQSELKRLLKRV